MTNDPKDDGKPEWGFYPPPRFCSKEDEDDVYEIALDSFVHRILLAATMNEKDGGTFGIGHEEERIGPMKFQRRPKLNIEKAQQKYEVNQRKQSNKTRDEKRTKKTKATKTQRGQREEMPRGSVQQFDGKPFVHLPLGVYKHMVECEVEGKLKQIQDYYDINLKRVEELYLDTLKEAIFWKDYANRIEVKLSLSNIDYQKMRENLENAKTQLLRYEERDSDKKFLPIQNPARRRRRGRGKDVEKKEEKEKRDVKTETVGRDRGKRPVPDMSCGDSIFW